MNFKTSNTYPFWNEDKGNVLAHKMNRYLEEQGFGWLQSSDDQNEDLEALIRIHDGTIGIRTPLRILTWLQEVLRHDPKLQEDEATKEKLLNWLVGFNEATFLHRLKKLKRYSEIGYEGTTKLNIFGDNKDECFNFFINGVIKITKEEVTHLEMDDLDTNGGLIWESDIIPHEIRLEKSLFRTDRNLRSGRHKGVFKDFVAYALKVGVEPKEGRNDVSEGTDSEDYKSRLKAFETAFGYMIHKYNPSDESKMVFFLDMFSNENTTDGGNGKSQTMKRVNIFRNLVEIDGKSWANPKQDAFRFKWRYVKRDTGFVMIDDLNPDFDLKALFPSISGDLTVEQKGKDGFIIPSHAKPNFGATTNYIPVGQGQSFARRIHIVEFGDFFNRADAKGIRPKDILGKNLPDDIHDRCFGYEDWDQLFNYAFYCIQSYLEENLVANPSSVFQRRQTARNIAGGNAGINFVDWIERWIKEDRVENDYHKEGIEAGELYGQFMNDTGEHNLNWDKGRFLTAVFAYCRETGGITYNSDHIKDGNRDTRKDRKWRKGGRGEQQDWIKIVTEKDED